MTTARTLNDFPITRKYPPRHPQHVQLYSMPTPNGIKVSIALEETGLPYDAHRIDIRSDAQFTPEFLHISPNNKIPAIIDPQGIDGQPVVLFESGAILIYLAEKTGQLLATPPRLRYQTLQWVMWQMAGFGPMLGQLGFFHKFAGSAWEDKRPLQRYITEAQRLLSVLDKHLQGRTWMVGDEYSIADIAIFPWVRTLTGFYEASALVEFDRFPQVQRVFAQFMQREAVQRSLEVPAA